MSHCPHEAQIMSSCGTVGSAASADWEALSPHLLPAVRACLLRQHPGAAWGWHNAGDACLKAEALCEALSLYHLLLSRDTIHKESGMTGMPHTRSSAMHRC